MHLRNVFIPALCLLAVSCTEAKKEETKSASEAKAPDHFKTKFDTSKGVFVIDITRNWAPRGADRFHQLVSTGYYDDARFYRVIKGFVVQWGINKDPKTNELWRELQIPDDPVKQPNERGYVSFAARGPATRTTQVFINLRDNSRQLDGGGFAPFGKVTEGMDVVDSLYAGYGEGAPRGEGPDQTLAQTMGNEYFVRQFPRLDYIKKATIER